MTRMALLSDEMWARVEPLLPPVKGAMGRPMREHRNLVEGAIYRYRTGILLWTAGEGWGEGSGVGRRRWPVRHLPLKV